MKKRKKQIANLLKISVFLFGVSLLLWNCEQEEDKVLLKEIQQEQTVTHIPLDEFKKKIIQNSSFKKFSLFFDVNQSHSTISQKNTSNSSDTIVLTNNITRIKKDGFSTYTFRVLTNNNDDSIYNLVVYVNGNNEIYKSHILKYIPSNEWRVNPSSYFIGKVFLVNNNLFNTSNLVFAKDADCLTGGTTYWECSFGFNHAPGTCNATSYEYVIDLEYGECDNGGNDDGVIINPTDPSEGGSSGGGADGGIVTAPDTTPYTQELKQFVSGTLNLAAEGVKSYYTSNSNITNTINNYLIQKGFSDFSKFEAMLNLEFGFSLGLNYESFVWAFNNKESEEVKAVKDFLVVNSTIEARIFAKKGVDYLINGLVSTFEEYVEESVPPSCKSFNFTKVGNYQYSYVKGIKFIVLSTDGKIKEYIRYDNAIEFGAPYLDRFNNVFKSNVLAEISAIALQEAMDNTKDYIKSRPWTNVGDVERYFEQELIRLYPVHIPGARVRIRPSHHLVSKITDYKSSGFSIGGVNFNTDDCN
ncbi:hypothetical protein ACXIHB_10030 [Tenacibaculum sp. IMCC1]